MQLSRTGLINGGAETERDGGETNTLKGECTRSPEGNEQMNRRVVCVWLFIECVCVETVFFVCILCERILFSLISIKADRNTNYETYILVLDNLNASYTVLRNKLAVKLYGKNYVSLLDDFKKSNNKDKSIEVKIKLIREKYPLLLSDADIKN